MPGAELIRVVTGLCAARDRAGTRPAAARATFFDRSHERLHTIAVALEAVDRRTAAGLLMAKQAVEADLSAQPPAPRLPADLDRLAALTRSGLAAIGLAAPACSDNAKE